MTTAMTKFWHAYATMKTETHALYPDVRLANLYHHWLSVNYARYRLGQFPARDPVTAPWYATPTLTYPTTWGHELAIEILEQRVNTSAYYFICLTWSRNPSPPLTPQSATHWWQQAYGYHSRLLVDRLPHDYLYFSYGTIDRFGRLSNPVSFGPLLIAQ